MATAVPTDTVAATALPEKTATPMPTVVISSLTLWLPPAFRADSNSTAGNILNQRIEDFEALYGVNVSIRIKAASGAGGLRDSLAATAAAAPGALPDVIALDQANLHAAAIKGLVFPLEDLLPPDAWEAFFPYALSMVTVEDHPYGTPFAGDAMVLASTVVPYPEPEWWEAVGVWAKPVILPLADSRALFLFYGYYAAGGTPMLSIAEAAIETEPLAQELTWLQTMQEGGVLSLRSLQIDSFEGSFLAIENIGECSATLYSIVSKNNDYFMTYLPTPKGARFSLATGWSWAIAVSDPARQAKAAELMMWLQDPQFLADWAKAQGVLPPSSTAAGLWPSGVYTRLAQGISEQAYAFPDEEISAFAGPVFSKAVRRVLLEGVSPAEAAQEAAKSIHS